MVGLVDDDRRIAMALRVRLRAYGFKVDWYGDLEPLDDLKPRDLPHAWIVDLGLPEGPLAGLERVRSPMSRTGTQDAPMAVLSDRGDLEERLAAVQGGHGLLDTLRASAPDVLLLDQHLPGCAGTDLAAVIRLDPRWVGLPILFLASEQDPAVEAAALQAGGDTWMRKPVRPDDLIGVVRSRGLRSRKFREHLFRDA